MVLFHCVQFTSRKSCWLILAFAVWSDPGVFCESTVLADTSLAQLTSKEIVGAFSTTLSQVRTIKLTYRVETTGHSVEKFRESNWWRDDSRERFREKWDALLGKSGMRRFLTDTLVDHRSNRVKVLHCSRDRRLLSEITVADQKDTSGMDMPLTPETSCLTVYETFLLRFRLVSTDRERTLRELCDYCGGATVLKPAEIGGVRCYHLKVQHPGVQDKFAGSAMEFYFDPQHGFLVRKLVKHIVGERGTTELRVEVKHFSAEHNGVFFPTDVDRYLISDGKMYQHSIARVTQLEINKPLDDGAFNLVFPKGLFVSKYEQPPGPNVVRVPVELIGEGGKVARRFEGDEFRAFVETLHKTKVETASQDQR